MNRVTARLRALRLYLVLAAVPAAVAFLVGGPYLGGLLAVMWVAIVLTVGMAATSTRQQAPNTWNPRGRLHGDTVFTDVRRGKDPRSGGFTDLRGR